MPRVPIEMVVVLGLFLLPHVERFVHYDEAHPVGQIEQLGRGGVVRRADRVGAHRPHDLELSLDRAGVHRGAQRAQIVVQAHAADLYRLAVEIET